MSYLDVPRIHFGGLFFTNPSTINNYDASFDPSVQLTGPQGQYLMDNPDGQGGPAGWNAVGTAQLWLSECTVLSAVGPAGTPVTGDPILGAAVESPSPATPKTTPDGKGFYDIAKLVDLDPDQQLRSAVYGLRIYVTIPGGAGFSGLLSVPELQFLGFTRVPNGGGSWGAVGTWMGQIPQVSWSGDVASSPFLVQFQQACQQGIAVKLTTDLHQNIPTTRLNPGNMFCYGRVMGSLGPIQPGELAQVVPGRRIAPPPPPSSSFGLEAVAEDEAPSAIGPRTINDLARQASLGAAESFGLEAVTPLAPWSTAFARISPVAGGSMLHVDLGGSIPLQGSVDANDVGTSNGRFVVDSGISIGILTAPGTVQPLAKGQVSFASQYQALNSQNKQVDLVTGSGLVDIPLMPNEAALLRNAPLAVTVNGTTVLQEPANGFLIGTQPFSLRLEPGTSATLQLMARKFGQPIVGQQPLSSWRIFARGTTVQPSTNVSVAWAGSTDANGIATLKISTVSTDPALPAFREPMDSQVYSIYLFDPSGQLVDDGYGQRMGSTNVSVSVLRFQSYTAPASPTWPQDVGPILQAYARLYPGMKDRLDIGDEATVKGFAISLLQRMALPFLDPAYMPVTRDLSPAKMAMILAWLRTQVPPPSA
jgi:hypothetical protein